MFNVAKFLRPKANSSSNDLGYNDAWLGLASNNPFPVNTIDHQEYEWGYNEALRDTEEGRWDSSTFYPSNEYGSEL